jgi:hypothetical protein
MKSLISLILATLFIVSILSSCGRSPYKKRHRCKGNGSWYGHRNLGAVDKIQKVTQKKYVWVSEEIQDKEM